MHMFKNSMWRKILKNFKFWVEVNKARVEESCDLFSCRHSHCELAGLTDLQSSNRLPGQSGFSWNLAYAMLMLKILWGKKIFIRWEQGHILFW